VEPIANLARQRPARQISSNARRLANARDNLIVEVSASNDHAQSIEEKLLLVQRGL
jgi:hypothetical protein